MVFNITIILRNSHDFSLDFHSIAMKIFLKLFCFCCQNITVTITETILNNNLKFYDSCIKFSL